MPILTPPGFEIPKILLPDPAKVDYTKWACIACDQFNAQPEYWHEVERIVGDSPSTLKLMLPEAFLKEQEERIPKINAEMQKYIDENIFIEHEGIILVKRTFGDHVRTGLMVAIDLEEYSFEQGTTSIVRATEATIVANLPPRIAIRKDAPVELPHILVLIDDPEKTVIEPAAEKCASLKPIYDFDLMMGSGHITGYMLPEDLIQDVVIGIRKLMSDDSYSKRYPGAELTEKLIYAVGDGNHSLATAKAIWENVKKTLGNDVSPNDRRRYALVELNNIHDEGIEFEPIHRVLIPHEASIDVVSELKESMKDWKECECTSLEQLEECVNKGEENRHAFGLINAPGKPRYTYVSVEPAGAVPYATVQTPLDVILKNHEGKLSIEYVHGRNAVDEIAKPEGENLGILMPPLPKNSLIRGVLEGGVLPRKSFSMGEAESKRFYLECRRID